MVRACGEPAQQGHRSVFCCGAPIHSTNGASSTAPAARGSRGRSTAAGSRRCVAAIAADGLSAPSAAVAPFAVASFAVELPSSERGAGLAAPSSLMDLGGRGPKVRGEGSLEGLQPHQHPLPQPLIPNASSSAAVVRSIDRHTTSLDHRERRRETGLLRLRCTRGIGSAPGSKQALQHLKRILMRCRCGALVEYASALRAATKAGRTELRVGDGCANRGCARRHQQGRYQHRQQQWKEHSHLHGLLSVWVGFASDDVVQSISCCLKQLEHT